MKKKTMAAEEGGEGGVRAEEGGRGWEAWGWEAWAVARFLLARRLMGPGGPAEAAGACGGGGRRAELARRLAEAYHVTAIRCVRVRVFGGVCVVCGWGARACVGRV